MSEAAHQSPAQSGLAFDDSCKSLMLTLARYNVYATRKLLDHVDALPEEHYRRDVGLPFSSVHGTLNHLIVAEHMLWSRRFRESVSPEVTLNEEVEPERTSVRQRLLEGCMAWLPYVEGLTAQQLGGELQYTTMRGVAVALPFSATLAHVFNHSTHHRGQISAAITGLGHACPELDLVFMLQHECERRRPA